MNYINLYANFLKKFLRPQRKLKVIFDCSNGTTGLILKKLLKNDSLIDYKLINQFPDGNFPGHEPDPMKRFALSDLRLAVIKNKADLGIIFDADGDRAFFIDNFGRFIDPDAIARLLIWKLKPGKIIIDVRTGWLVKNITNHCHGCPEISNIKIIESRVGHYFIKKLMRKIDADFAAEYSGHYYLKKFFYADSGIMTAIETINTISRLPYSPADFNDLLPQYYRSGEINIKISKSQIAKGKAQSLFKKIEKKLKNRATKISHLDGLTMEFNPSAGSGQAWRFNIRPSNTEPIIRLNIEATDKKLLKQSQGFIIKNI